MTCAGYEWHPWDNVCELHVSPGDFYQTGGNPLCRCVEKVYAPGHAPTERPATAAPTQPPVSGPTYPPVSASGAWFADASLPGDVAEVASAIVDGKLYVFGQVSPQTFVFDLTTRQWRTAGYATRPHTGNHHAIVSIGTRIYLVGALDRGTRQLQIYDTVANTWSVGAQLPWASDGSGSAVVMDSSIYACSGRQYRRRYAYSKNAHLHELSAFRSTREVICKRVHRR